MRDSIGRELAPGLKLLGLGESGASSLPTFRFLDFSVGLILRHYSVLHDFVFFPYNRMMSTESSVLKCFLLHCITARHVEGAAGL
jgi:hypothetical protein